MTPITLNGLVAVSSESKKAPWKRRSPTIRSGGRAPVSTPIKLGFVFHAASLPQQASFVDQFVIMRMEHSPFPAKTMRFAQK